jgi:hypothetical protein
MKQATNSFVAYFDILGFKALRARKGTASLHQKLVRGILPGIQHAAAGAGMTVEVGGQLHYVPHPSEFSIEYKMLSDSVFFFTADDSFRGFVGIVNATFLLLQFGFVQKTPFRGAIGWGDGMIGPENVLVGSGVEDAVAGEKRQHWAGAMLTEGCLNYVEQQGFAEAYQAMYLKSADDLTLDPSKQSVAHENGKRLVRYDVPTQTASKSGGVKYGVFDTLAVDWTIRMYEGAAGAAFTATSDPHVAGMSNNTVAFESWARKHNR